MEKLWRQGAYLEAMDTATLVLTYDDRNHAATEFVHRNWDNMQRRVDKELNALNDPDDLSEAAKRCEIYRLLDEIHGNLSVVRMPLEGHNQSWVWQPQVSYYSGHYDNERMKTYRLLLRYATRALQDRDTEAAGQYIETALYKYLLTAGEKRKCRKEVAAMCNEKLEKAQKSQEIHDAIYAYDLSALSLRMDSTQTELRQQQPRLQQRVSDMYRAEAQTALQAGDSIRADELMMSANDWNTVSEQ